MITYFVKAGDFVKIGRSADFRRRMEFLQTSTPHDLNLLKLSDMAESAAHAKACTLSKRIRGEWFEATESLLEWILGIEGCADVSEFNDRRTKRVPSLDAAKTFAQKLQAYRGLLKMTQPAAAEFLGVSPRQYAEWESGRVAPMEITQEGAIARLADAETPDAERTDRAPEES